MNQLYLVLPADIAQTTYGLELPDLFIAPGETPPPHTPFLMSLPTHNNPPPIPSYRTTRPPTPPIPSYRTAAPPTTNLHPQHKHKTSAETNAENLERFLREEALKSQSPNPKIGTIETPSTDDLPNSPTLQKPEPSPPSNPNHSPMDL